MFPHQILDTCLSRMICIPHEFVPTRYGMIKVHLETIRWKVFSIGMSYITFREVSCWTRQYKPKPGTVRFDNMEIPCHWPGSRTIQTRKKYLNSWIKHTRVQPVISTDVPVPSPWVLVGRATRLLWHDILQAHWRGNRQTPMWPVYWAQRDVSRCKWGSGAASSRVSCNQGRYSHKTWGVRGNDSDEPGKRGTCTGNPDGPTSSLGRELCAALGVKGQDQGQGQGLGVRVTVKVRVSWTGVGVRVRVKLRLGGQGQGKGQCQLVMGQGRVRVRVIWGSGSGSRSGSGLGSCKDGSESGSGSG